MAGKLVLISMLLVFGAVAQDEKEMKIEWADRADMGLKMQEFVVAEGIDESDWTHNIVYADGSVLVQTDDKLETEEVWPITHKFVKRSSLSDEDRFNHEKKEAEEEAAAQIMAEEAAAEQARKDAEEKAKAEEEKKLAEEKAAKEAEEAAAAGEAAEKAAEEEEAARLAKEKADKEKEEAEAAAAAAADQAAKEEAERIAKEKAEEAAAALKKAQEAEAAAAAAKLEKERQEAEALAAAQEQAELAAKNALRSLKWRWRDNGPFPFIGMVPKTPMEDNWHESTDREDLKNQISNKVLKSPAAEKKNKEYETRRVELADMEDPTRRRTFDNYVKVIEWLMLEHNLQANDEL